MIVNHILDLHPMKGGAMKEKKEKDEKDKSSSEEIVSRRKFLSAGKTVLLGASYVVISVFADKGDAIAAPDRYASCTSGATTVTPPACSSCTACTGCTGCTKWCISGCCISCTKCTSQ